MPLVLADPQPKQAPPPLKGLPSSKTVSGTAQPPALAALPHTPTDPLAPPPNLGLAVTAGLVVALVCAGAWASLAIAIGYQIGVMALGVGLTVGLTVRMVGRGNAPVFSLSSAALALLGCVVGNLLTFTALDAEFTGTTFMTSLLNLTLPEIHHRMLLYFNPMDLLFYGIAMYAGFRLAPYGAPQPEPTSTEPTAHGRPKPATDNQA